MSNLMSDERRPPGAPKKRSSRPPTESHTGHLWKSMDTCGNPWTPLEIHGKWKSMESRVENKMPIITLLVFGCEYHL